MSGSKTLPTGHETHLQQTRKFWWDTPKVLGSEREELKLYDRMNFRTSRHFYKRASSEKTEQQLADRQFVVATRCL